MSALPPKADIGTQSRNVRFVPGRDSCSAAKFIHLIGDWGAIGWLVASRPSSPINPAVTAVGRWGWKERGGLGDDRFQCAVTRSWLAAFSQVLARTSRSIPPELGAAHSW